MKRTAVGAWSHSVPPVSCPQESCPLPAVYQHHHTQPDCLGVHHANMGVLGGRKNSLQQRGADWDEIKPAREVPPDAVFMVSCGLPYVTGAMQIRLNPKGPMGQVQGALDILSGTTLPPIPSFPGSLARPDHET